VDHKSDYESELSKKSQHGDDRGSGAALIDDAAMVDDVAMVDDAEKNRVPLPVIAGICFSAVVIILGTINILFSLGIIPDSFRDFRIQLPILQIGCILLPTLLILYMSKHNIKDVLRLNMPKAREVILAIALPVILFPAVLCLGNIALLIIEYIFNTTDVSATMNFMNYNIFLLIFLVALLPGICEETLFRGVLLKGFQKNGIVFGIVLSSILFGMVHMDFQRFIAQAAMGAVAGIIVYRTNSIFCGMIVHFTHNAIALGLAFLASSLLSGSEAAADVPAVGMMSMVITYLYVAAAFAAISIPLFMALFKVTRRKLQQVGFERQPIRFGHYIAIIPGLIIVLFFYYSWAVHLLRLPI
jgi:membrane protease YdiL (CAAX protease family)